MWSSMTHTGAILACVLMAVGFFFLLFFLAVQPGVKRVTDFTTTWHWMRYEGSGLCGNWLTDGAAGTEACEVSGLTLRLLCHCCPSPR